MTLQQTKPSDIPVGPPVRPRGILAAAAAAPDGWEQGGISTNRLCPNPQLMDKCITFDSREAERPYGTVFPAFTIEQGSGCSTLSYGDRAREARESLDSVTDYALGVALSSATFNVDAPSLSDADALGSFPTAVAALAALEGAASRYGRGQMYVIHATPSAAIYLAEAGLMTDTGITPSGATVIVSAGYENSAGDLNIWATGRVWASVGDITVRDAVAQRMNDREAWASRDAVVGFNACINLSATIALAAG